MSSTPAAATPVPGPLERVARIAGLVAQSSERNEALGRLAPEVVDALHAERMFRLLLPAAYGGEEIDAGTWFRTMEALARLDASTAWCVGQINGCALTASAVAPEVARTVWGAPRAALSWGPPVRAHAEAVDGGHRLTGEWMMSSGSRHATWIGLTASMQAQSGQQPSGAPVSEGAGVRTFLVPAEQVEWVDNWNVHGLVATNSGGYRAEGVFVPDGFSVERHHLAEVRLDGPLYKFPLNSLFALGFSAVTLGIARAMLDAAVALALDKTPRAAKSRLRDSPVVQLQIGEAEARLRSARGFVESTADRVWQSVAATGELTLAQRIDIRMAATFAIHEAKAVADAAWDVAGASAIFEQSPFERRMRDLRTVTQQMQGRKSHLQDVGAFLLGHPPSLLFA